jgi:hypothetical protein
MNNCIACLLIQLSVKKLQHDNIIVGPKNSTMKKGFFGIILSLELVAIVIFTIAGWQADRALDKSGIGDPEKFTYWNNIAGISFYIFVRCLAGWSYNLNPYSSDFPAK